jgi:hypothetical protein
LVIDPVQTGVKHQLEFSISGEEIKPLYFTEKGLYECLMRSGKQVAMEFKDSILLFFKDLRNKKIQVTYNEDSEFQANRHANPNVFIDALTD